MKMDNGRLVASQFLDCLATSEVHNGEDDPEKQANGSNANVQPA